MRLTEFEKKKIHENCSKVFGTKSRVYLFGSRVNDLLRGGDIDLYIIPEQNAGLNKKESLFLVRLYEQIGEQKIDIVFQNNTKSLIEQEAVRQGVLL